MKIKLFISFQKSISLFKFFAGSESMLFVYLHYCQNLGLEKKAYMLSRTTMKSSIQNEPF